MYRRRPVRLTLKRQATDQVQQQSEAAATSRTDLIRPASACWPASATLINLAAVNHQRPDPHPSLSLRSRTGRGAAPASLLSESARGRQGRLHRRIRRTPLTELDSKILDIAAIGKIEIDLTNSAPL